MLDNPFLVFLISWSTCLVFLQWPIKAEKVFNAVVLSPNTFLLRIGSKYLRTWAKQSLMWGLLLEQNCGRSYQIWTSKVSYFLTLIAEPRAFSSNSLSLFNWRTIGMKYSTKKSKLASIFKLCSINGSTQDRESCAYDKLKKSKSTNLRGRTLKNFFPPILAMKAPTQDVQVEYWFFPTLRLEISRSMPQSTWSSRYIFSTMVLIMLKEFPKAFAFPGSVNLVLMKYLMFIKTFWHPSVCWFSLVTILAKPWEIINLKEEVAAFWIFQVELKRYSLIPLMEAAMNFMAESASSSA